MSYDSGVVTGKARAGLYFVLSWSDKKTIEGLGDWLYERILSLISLQDFEAWQNEDLENSSSGGVALFAGRNNDLTSTSTSNSQPTLRDTGGRLSTNNSNTYNLEGVQRYNATNEPERRVTREGLQKFLECAENPAAGGLIFVMTAQNVAGVDPRLLRPGRLDRVIHLGKVTREMAEKLFQQFYAKVEGDIKTEYDEAKVEGWSKEWAKSIPDELFTLADLKGMLIIYRIDPEGAVKNMNEWLASKGVSVSV